MTHKTIGFATVSLACFTLIVWLSSSSDIAVAETSSISMAPLVMGDGDGGSGYAYVGAKKCKMCHTKQHKSWKTTKMANAMDTLKPGAAAEIKTKHGLDPKKDYTTDVTCLQCHTTGFGAEGGYAIPDPNDKKAVRKAKKLAGVSCESCHGPGSEYIKIHKDLLMTKRKYKVEELYAAGMTKIDATTCTTCHNEQNPTNPGDFDFDKKKDEGTHKHLPLKQRE